MKRMFGMIVFIILALYLAACTTVYSQQRALIYHPMPATVENQRNSVEWQHDGERLRVTQILRSGTQAILYFGGNAEDVSYTAQELSQVFPDKTIYALHYRSYAGSTGQPSEASLVGDAIALFDKVHEQYPHIQVMGRSLGTGIAVQLAHARNVEKMVLVTPYDSMQAVAQGHYPYLPVGLLLKDKYNSVQFAPDIKIPVTLLVAEQDTLIPPIHAQRLKMALPQTTVKSVTFAGKGHNDIDQAPDFWPIVHTALQ